MKKNNPNDDQSLNEIASLLALGILRRKSRLIEQNKGVMARKALDFRATRSIHVRQEQDDE